MRGKTLVFAANAVIFLTLAILGLLLGQALEATAAQCAEDEEPDALCERSLVAGRSSRATAAVLGLVGLALAGVAIVLAWRDRRTV